MRFLVFIYLRKSCLSEVSWFPSTTKTTIKTKTLILLPSLSIRLKMSMSFLESTYDWNSFFLHMHVTLQSFVPLASNCIHTFVMLLICRTPFSRQWVCPRTMHFMSQLKVQWARRSKMLNLVFTGLKKQYKKHNWQWKRNAVQNYLKHCLKSL